MKAKEKVFLNAVLSNDVDQVHQYLIEGANPEAKNAEGKTAIQLALELGYEQMLCLLYEFADQEAMADANDYYDDSCVEDSIFGGELALFVEAQTGYRHALMH